MLKAISDWFMGLFRNNRAMLKLGIQIVAGEFFKKYPRYKATVRQMSDDVIRMINADVMSVGDVKKSLYARVEMLDSNPAEKAALIMMVDSLLDEVFKYFTKAKVNTVAAQAQVLVQVLGWVIEASNF